ncbi:Intracellular hyphae protein [Lachnellula suecica]|uniref:Intracellular hyphae protein n=1 Tax=Lachnellula suecica TaxID=602035 RepID=A0A8T9BTC4_9HELO|nr:Intracellular hyphae protein [Lachnellula suecica]
MKSLIFAVATILPLVSGHHGAYHAENLEPCRIVDTHTVVGEDTLGFIATQYNSTVSAIPYGNPDIKNVNYISNGQVIQIPATECNDVAPELVENPPATHICAAPRTENPYTVVQGDTLFIISDYFRITLDSLIAANPQITDPDLIEVGDMINIPICGTCAPQGTVNPYVVVSGDTLTDIAGRLGVTLEALEAVNGQIEDFDVIEVDDEVNVPICGSFRLIRFML